MPVADPMRECCYSCYRPITLCLCPTLPTVPNRTEIVVLQHPRERTHPFGSARMLTQALRRGSLSLVHRGQGRRLADVLPLDGGRTALLYPRPDAKDLASIGEEERPERLVLLDGTWSHAHRLYQDNPWLHTLPHYRLHPTRASRYLVRKEPKAHCLSTLV